MRWSFSMWTTYNTCPSRFNYRYRQRLPDPPSPAAQRGSAAHDTAERYVRGHSMLLPTKDNYLLDVFNKFRQWPNGDRHTELKITLTDEWTLTSPQNDDAYVTGVLDVVGYHKGVVEIGEWKTGKPKDEHKEQRSLYALLGLRRWLPREVQVTTYYMDNTAPPARLTVKDTAEPKLIQIWDGRAKQMLTDDTCAPRPGFYCRWCPYSRDKGGPCKVG